MGFRNEILLIFIIVSLISFCNIYFLIRYKYLVNTVFSSAHNFKQTS